MLVLVFSGPLTTFASSEDSPAPLSCTIWQKGNCYFYQDSYNNTIGSSTNASGTIQNALNSLTSGRTWKEKIVLQGVFTISSTLRIPSYTILDCSEAELIAAPGLNAPVITNGNLTSGDHDIELDVGSLDGNAANQNDTSPYPYGVYIGAENPNQVYNIIIQGNFMNTLRETIFLDRVANAYLDVSCSGSKNYEGVVLRASHDIQARITAWNNSQANVYLDYCWDCQITAITSGGKYGVGLHSSTQNQITAVTELASADGIFVSEGSDENVISGTSYCNARNGIWVSNSCNEEISGQYHDNGGSGIALYNVNRSEISVNSYNNGKTIAQSDGIYGYDCFHLTVMSSQIYDSQSLKTQDRPIVSAGAGDYWEVIDNDLVDGGLHPPDFVGSNNIIEENLGLVTENSGTVTGSSPITVFHGLAGTPTLVVATLRGSTPLYFSVVDRNATTFTIICSGNTNQTFDWYAEYKPGYNATIDSHVSTSLHTGSNTLDSNLSRFFPFDSLQLLGVTFVMFVMFVFLFFSARRKFPNACAKTQTRLRSYLCTLTLLLTHALNLHAHVCHPLQHFRLRHRTSAQWRVRKSHPIPFTSLCTYVRDYCS